MPAAVLALPWGSKSINRTFFFVAANAAERLTAVVVFPTPPFWLAIAIICFIFYLFLRCASLSLWFLFCG